MALWLRKRGAVGRFLLVTPCISVSLRSMHGSVYLHMVYSVRAKLAVQITARLRRQVQLFHSSSEPSRGPPQPGSTSRANLAYHIR
jgi:hypothetical protein